MSEPHQFPFSAQVPGPDASGKPRANVIWFTVDQMRAQAMSLVGDPNVNTPNLDRMARDGMHFNRAVSGFPLCCPARGSWLTGQYPHHVIPGHEYLMDPAIPTVADAFNAAGYHTAWLGKWHLDGHHERDLRGGWHHVPAERRGRFKTWIAYDNNNSQYDCWVHGHDEERDVPIYRLPGHETDALTDLLIDQIDRHRDEPFFLSCAVQPPHDPYTAPPEFSRRFNPATLTMRPNVPAGDHFQVKARQELAGYYALIEHIDENVGRVMRHLEETGLSDTTYLVFTSDHGDHHGSHGHFRKMTPHEESIRVPFMIWGGKRWQYRSGWGAFGHPVNHVDLAPTSLGLAGISPPAEMEGFDYSAVARGNYQEPAPAVGPDLSEAPTSAYLQVVIPTGHGPSIDQPWRGIVTNDGWKYVCVEGQPWMLFDLNTDPYEQCNLVFHAHARTKRQALQGELAAWIERTGDSFALPEFREDGRPAAIDSLHDRFQHLWRVTSAP